MPATNLSSSEWFQRMLQKLTQRVSAIETQQNFGVRDHTMQVRMQGGLLRDGGFGIAVYTTATGKFHRVSPPQAATVGGTLTTSSTSYATLGGPEVASATVGEAGCALVSGSCVVGIDGRTVASATYWQGVIGVQVDGGRIYGVASASTSSFTLAGHQFIVPLQFTITRSLLVTGLSQGAHSFRMMFLSTKGQAVHFSTNSLVVIPY